MLFQQLDLPKMLYGYCKFRQHRQIVIEVDFFNFKFIGSPLLT